MAMPRPSGEAQKIAEETVPGLNRNQRTQPYLQSKDPRRDEVELKIIHVNENKGRNYP